MDGNSSMPPETCEVDTTLASRRVWLVKVETYAGLLFVSNGIGPTILRRSHQCDRYG